MKFLEQMRVSSRLLVAGIAVLIGLVVIAGYTLNQIRADALEAHNMRLKDLVETAQGTIKNYQQLEISGSLTREEAQSKAKEALRIPRFGNDDYFFLYDYEGRALMVAGKPDIEGQVLLGKTDAAGYLLWDALVERGKSGQGYFDYVFPRAGQTTASPKRSYVIGIPEWQWIVGTGVYVDDVDQAVSKAALRYASLSALVLALLAVVSMVVSRSIVNQLGGEPLQAAENMRKIANGNLGIDIPLKENDTTSLMASLRLMQMKLTNITSAIQENSTVLSDQVQGFEAVAKTYGESKTDEDFVALNRAVKKLGKTADILKKSISRFKL